MAHTAEILVRIVMENSNVTVRNINGTLWLYNEATMDTATVESVPHALGGGYRILYGNSAAHYTTLRMDYGEVIERLTNWAN